MILQRFMQQDNDIVRKQGTEVREGGVSCKHALCGSVRISRRDTLDENLGLVEVEGKASVLGQRPP